MSGQRRSGAGQAGRLELLGVMDEDDMRASVAWLAAACPEVFDRALGAREGMTARLRKRLEEAGAGDLEPYCSRCGEEVAVFYGHGPGWHHWRNTADGRTVIYTAAHEVAVSWRPAGER